MTWDPGPRPAWVQHALDGEGGPVYELAQEPFDVDRLVDEARLRAGLDDFGGDSFVEPLTVLCRSLDEEAGLHAVGRWRVREVVLRNLDNRLRMVEELRRHPAIAGERIAAPLVVSGQPRAGTSILHQLLGADPVSRVPLAWEYWCPAPSPDPAHATDDPRIPLANRDVRLSASLAPSFDGMHEQGALLPREDGSAMTIDFRGDPLFAHYPVPSFAEWFHADDMVPAYDWWVRVLQTLQHRHPPRRWVTKMPGHLARLPALFDALPDAQVVICHRDPLEMLSSVTSLLATLRWAHAERVDYHALAQEQADYYVMLLDRLVDQCRSGRLDERRVAHVHFAALNADPISTVRGIYERFGMEYTDEFEQIMRSHLAAKPKGRHGGHAHTFADLGLDPVLERARFAGYQEYFGIPSEELV